MSIGDFLFGAKSNRDRIEADWQASVDEIRRTGNAKLKALEDEKCLESGLNSPRPARTMDEKVKRLEEIDRKIDSVMNEMFEMENDAFFKRLELLKRDKMASASLPRRVALWLYWNA